jgi:hypothetical protein
MLFVKTIFSSVLKSLGIQTPDDGREELTGETCSVFKIKEICTSE